MKNRQIINWELSLACNLDCSFCSQKERRNINNKIPNEENIYKIIDNIPSNSHISFLGGETLLVPYIINIFNKLEEKGISYEITTNGILLEKYLSDFEYLNNLTQINVSIDGYGDFHDKSRGKKGLFKTLLKILPVLKNIKNVSISTVVSNDLSNENIIKLHLWLNSIGIYEHKLIYMMNFSSNDAENSISKISELKIGKPGSEKLDNDMLKKDFLEKVALLKKLGTKTKTKIKIEPIALFKGGKLFCKQLDKQLRIDENGRLSICEFITNSFDDISKVSSEEAVKNNDYLKLRELIKDDFPLDICRTCCKLES